MAEFGDQAGRAGATGRGMNAVASSLLSGPTAVTELRQDSSQSLSGSIKHSKLDKGNHKHAIERNQYMERQPVKVYKRFNSVSSAKQT